MRIRSYFAVTIVVVTALANWAVAAENHPTLTLDDAVARTLTKNPHLYQYRFKKESLLGQRESRSLSPAIQLELETENFAGSGDFDGLDYSETTLALSSVIELGSKTRARVGILDAKKDRLHFERQVATLDVLGELTALFIRCLATQENIALAQEAVALSEQRVKTVKRRADKGAAPDADVMRAKAALARAQLRLQALRSNLKRQKVALSSYWGNTRPHFTELSGSLTTVSDTADFASLYERAKRSPDIAVFASEARLKDAEVKLVRAQSRVDIGWQFGIRRFEETNDTALVAGISVPLFNGKRNKGIVASALAERNAVDYQEADALLKLHNRLFAAYSQMEENQAAVEQFSAVILPALEHALAATQQAYENGRYRYQDWVSAQEELLDAKQQRIEAATGARLSQALIEQLTAEPLESDTLTY